jgi:hypothetical protein
LSNLDIRSLAISGTIIYAGSFGNGVWKRPLSEMTGIEDVSATLSMLNVYPNPAKDNITININNRNSNEDATLNIYNVTGVLIKSKILKQNLQEINVSDISNGIYMIEFKSEGLLEKQKLIIQR